MRRRFAGMILLLCCLLLSGCASLLDREYSVVEKHTSKYWESDAAGDTLRAESYQDVVNDLLLLVGEHREEATLRLYDESGDAAPDIMERAAAEVQQETAMGSYAVEYITTELRAQHGYYEVDVHIAYRRTEEQLNAIVNATSTAALQNLLVNAMWSGRTELAVRIGYWDEEDVERVAEAIDAAGEKWEEENVLHWAASFYPAQGDVGLIEFRLENVPETESGEVAGDGAGGTAGEETEIPGEGGENTAGAETPDAGGSGPASGGAQTLPDGETADRSGTPGVKDTPAAGEDEAAKPADPASDHEGAAAKTEPAA